MSDDRPAVDVAHPPAAATGPAGTAAVDRYTARMRPWRIVYAALITVAAVVLVVIVKIAYSHGEISHATLRTVAVPPPSVALHVPPTGATLAQAWSSTDATAIGTPYFGGTVVTHDHQTVRGRNALTGTVTWSYSRSDRTVCQAIQDQGVTIAVYELHGNCDELTALDSATGARKWTRTLDKDGAEFNGPARYAVVPNTVMFVSAGAIYALDPSGDSANGNGGLDRWVFADKACRINGAVLGSTGALISQTCTNRDCSDQKFCGNGRQLLLRDGVTGEDNNSSTNHRNPDQIKWNLLDSTLLPASADQVVAALEPGGARLAVLNSKTGKAQNRLALAQHSTTVSGVATAADAELLRVGTTTYAIESNAARFTWQAQTAALPTVTGSGGATPNLDVASLAVPTRNGVALLDTSTGKARTNFTVRIPAATGQAFPVGRGFLIAGSTTAFVR